MWFYYMSQSSWEILAVLIAYYLVSVTTDPSVDPFILGFRGREFWSEVNKRKKKVKRNPNISIGPYIDVFHVV